ncbi:sugar ABC transporter substrate-binding protein [Kaarinaea lacus]
MNRFYIALSFLFLSVGCDQQSTHDGDVTSRLSNDTVIRVWAHAGQAAERDVLQSQVEQFNQQQRAIRIALTFIPEGHYNAQVQAAALAGELPDVLEFDGPYLYNYIWQQQLLPLDTLLPSSLLHDLLPSVIDQGTHGKHLYSVAVFDSGLGLYARKSALQQIGARIPARVADAWSSDEFNSILDKLAAQDPDRAVLDLKLNYTGEWFTYGFSPVLQSAGADLIERASYQTSTDVINSAAAITVLEQIQRWIQAGRVDPNLDDAAFISGRVMLSWVGHWEYARYKQAWQDDLVVLPLPDFGNGSKTGQGSWNWGITAGSKNPQAASEFLRFLLQKEQVLAMCNANGAVPGTRSAVEHSALYSKQGELHLFTEQLMQGAAIPRPKTPAYPIITTAFQQAFQQIRNGANVKATLDTAAQRINQDIRDNQGYPFVSD